MTERRGTPAGTEVSREPARRLGTRVALTYAAIAALWIVASDWIVHAVFRDPTSLTVASTVKGWLFVAVTAVLLGLYVERGLRSIRASERVYREMVEGGPAIYLKLDEGSRIVSVSSGGAESLGHRPEELRGRSMIGLYAEPDRRLAMEHLDAVSREPGTTRRFVSRVVRSDGSLLRLRQSARAIRGPGGAPSLLLVAESLEDGGKEGADPVETLGHLRSLVLASPVAIVALDRESRVLTWNPAAERMFGWKEAEVVGRPTPLVPDEIFEEVSALRARVMAGESFSGLETVRLRKDGVRVEVSASAAPLRDESGSVVAMTWVYSEIGEAKKSAARLYLTTSELRGIFRALPDLYFRLDRRNRILSSYAGRESDLYVPPERFLGKTMLEVLPEEPAATLSDAISRARATGSALAEYRLAVPSGEKEFEARLVTLLEDQLLVIVRDVTERRRALDSIRRSAERLELLQAIDRAILAAESIEEVAAAVAPRLRRLVPCDHASVVVFDGIRSSATVLAADSEPQAGPRSGDSLPLGAWTPGSRDALLAASGIRAFLEVPLPTEDHLPGVLLFASRSPREATDEERQIASDVASQLAVALRQARLREALARHAAELERRVEERTRELTAANEELESFSYSVTHDLRAPLRAVDGFARALLEDHAGKLDAAGIEYARRLVAAASRMDVLVQDLLRYSRLGRSAMPPRRLSLDSVVAEALLQHEATVKSSGGTVEIASPLGDATAHRSTLVQVVGNLLDNALKFTEPGRLPKVRIRAEDRGEHVALVVEDEGIGIRPEDRERIFRAFERLHGIESYPGSGIGLAIVKRGIERMGGRVELDSEPGRGSRFRLVLPGASLRGEPPAEDEGPRGAA